MISGKGFWLWLMYRAEDGNIQRIIDKCVEAELGHLIVKVADGTVEYIGNTRYDLVSLKNGLASHNIKLLGYAYVYGVNPTGEANKIIEMVRKYGFDEFVINAEVEYKNRRSQATTLMSILSRELPNVKFYLSSYRYPNLHMEFPWREFLSGCDYAMPQVYWIGAQNSAYQARLTVQRYQELFSLLGLSRPIVLTGAAFSEHGWVATPNSVDEFLIATEELVAQGKVVNAVNFWEWWEAREDNPSLWPVIANYPWKDTPEIPPMPEPTPIGKVKFVAAPPMRIQADRNSAQIGTIYKNAELYVFEHVVKANGQEEWVRIGVNVWVAIKYYQYTNAVWI